MLLRRLNSLPTSYLPIANIFPSSRYALLSSKNFSFASAKKTTPLFQAKLPLRMNTPPIRWQNTQVSKTQTATPSSSNPDQKRWVFSEGMGRFLFGSSIVTNTLALFYYIYNQPPSDQWPKWLRDIRPPMSTDTLIRSQDISEKIKKILKKEIYELNTSHENRIIKSIESFKKEKNQLSTEYDKAKKKLSEQHETILDELRNSHKKELEDQAGVASPVFLEWNLLEQCAPGNEKCVLELHKFLRTKGELSYPYNHTFDKNFLPLFQQALVESLNPRIHILNLSGTYMTSNNALTYIMNGLKNNETINNLNLNNTGLRSKEVKIIIDMLKINKNIKEIDLSGNFLSDSDAGDLMNDLSNKCALKKIDLSNNFVSNEKKAQLSAALNITVL
ncbi:MAG: hypothetical protein K1000chlam3_00316 [Chlamydiae bacterium]|nr:hypothetical protein [Chlamydiota bacterium]